MSLESEALRRHQGALSGLASVPTHHHAVRDTEGVNTSAVDIWEAQATDVFEPQVHTPVASRLLYPLRWVLRQPEVRPNATCTASAPRRSKNSPMVDCLPYEVWLMIFDRLTDAELEAPRQTCARWRQCIDDPAWRRRRLVRDVLQPALVRIAHQVVHDGLLGPWFYSDVDFAEKLIKDDPQILPALAEQCRQILATFDRMQRQSAWTHVESFGAWTRFLPLEDRLPHLVLFFFCLSLMEWTAPVFVGVLCALWLLWHIVGVILEECCASDQATLRAAWQAPENRLLREGLCGTREIQSMDTRPFSLRPVEANR